METGCHKCGADTASDYLLGFCHACAKSILNAAKLRLRRKPSTVKADKRLEQDLARAQAAIAALATAESRHALRSVCETPSPEAIASLRQAIESESRRMSRALSDHRLLWSIYRRTDKSKPYYESPVAKPVSVLPAEREELVAA